MSETSSNRPSLGEQSVLHRSLDVHGHAELVARTQAAEVYKTADGQHAWTLKRFSGAPATDYSGVAPDA